MSAFYLRHHTYANVLFNLGNTDASEMASSSRTYFCCVALVGSKLIPQNSLLVCRTVIINYYALHEVGIGIIGIQHVLKNLFKIVFLKKI